jgi:hypothetical protein
MTDDEPCILSVTQKQKAEVYSGEVESARPKYVNLRTKGQYHTDLQFNIKGIICYGFIQPSIRPLSFGIFAVTY